MMLFNMVMSQEDTIHSKKNKIDFDESIFIRIAENDMNAFEELYSKTQKSVYAFALSILRNHEDSMDVLQDTYLKVRGAAHLYKPMGKPMAWIFTIARNLALSKLRTASKINSISVEDIEDNISFSYVTNKEDKIVLMAALNILDVEEREIILLHAISGFKHREIAKSLGISLGTVLSKYNRGLKKLKKHLNEQGVRG